MKTKLKGFRMRTSRRKLEGQGCLHHCYNRVAGPTDYYPFSDVDKEFAFRLLEDLNRLYSTELISVVILDNHFHVILFSPADGLTPEEAAARHNAYYCDKDAPTYAPWRISLDPNIAPERCAQVAKDLNDISHFMGTFQQRFSFYINRVHNRRGRLWADRFKNVILEGKSALWNCVKYVELNAVRAGIVESPADYRFCSWGAMNGRGKHPFADAFTEHMKQGFVHSDTTNWTLDDVCRELRGEFARIIESELETTGKELLDKVETARKGDSIPTKFLRRTRYWTDGAIIGSKAFVQEIALNFETKERMAKKRFGKSALDTGDTLYSFRQLRS